jgi:hypothetical protein
MFCAPSPNVCFVGSFPLVVFGAFTSGPRALLGQLPGRNSHPPQMLTSFGVPSSPFASCRCAPVSPSDGRLRIPLRPSCSRGPHLQLGLLDTNSQTSLLTCVHSEPLTLSRLASCPISLNLSAFGVGAREAIATNTCKVPSRSLRMAGQFVFGARRWLDRTLRSSVTRGPRRSAPLLPHPPSEAMAIRVCSATGKLFSATGEAPRSSAYGSSSQTLLGRGAPQLGLPCGQTALSSGAAASALSARCDKRSRRRQGSLALSGCRAPLPAAAGGRGIKRRAPPPLRDESDRAPGFLHRSRVTLLTRARYLDAYQKFVAAVGKQFDRVHFPQQVALPVFDEGLETYIESLFVKGADKSAVNYLIAAVSHLLCWPKHELSRSCPRALACLTGWSRREPDKSKEPCPWTLAALTSKTIAAWDLPNSREAARAVVVQFGFMLRPSETTDLKVASCFGGELKRGRYDRCAVVVAPSASDAADAECLASLEQAPRSSKTGTFDDTVILDANIIDPAVRLVFLATLREARAAQSEYLFGQLSYRSYFKMVAAAGVQLRLPFALTPHMFRHGAASEDFFRGLRDLAGIQQRGRWKCPASVQRYQKAGRLLTVLRKCGDVIIEEAKRADAEHLAFLL